MKNLFIIIVSCFVSIVGCSEPKIGSCYELNQRDPFAKKTQIKILDFKKDFFQFCYTDEPNKIDSDRAPVIWKMYWAEIPCEYTEVKK
jgi:hypothetical protein